MLVEIAETACEPPTGFEGNAEDVPLGFVSASRRAYYEDYNAEHGHYPMFRILVDYLTSDEATRDDKIFALSAGLVGDAGPQRTDDIAVQFGLTRERVRQILVAYHLPARIGPVQRWQAYCDHSTYFINEASDKFRHVCDTEVNTLTFRTYAAMLTRTVMLDLVEDRFLVRRGWTKELTAWIKRLERLAGVRRTIESRISIEGLAMGGALDARMRSVVLNQIAPALGIRTEAPDLLVFSK